jgi:hypothetical protein
MTSQTNGDTFTIQNFNQPAHGTLVQNGNILTYTANTGYIGTDTFNYLLCDNDGCSTANVTINVNCPPVEEQLPPTANNDSFNATCSTATLNVTANDAQTNGDNFDIVGFSQAAHGTVTQNANTLSYTANNGYVGSDSFTYNLCDNDGCTTATVTLTVNCPPAEEQLPPTANNDNFTANCGTATLNVIANDTQTNGDNFNVTGFSQAAHGTVTQNANTLNYTANAGYIGADSFTYNICDNDGCTTATVTLTVNCPPTEEQLPSHGCKRYPKCRL